MYVSSIFCQGIHSSLHSHLPIRLNVDDSLSRGLNIKRKISQRILFAKEYLVLDVVERFLPQL